VTQVFLIDRSVGKNVIATALHAAGATVEVHDDHFKQDAFDEEWLPIVGRRGWAVITSDDRIRYRAVEREAATSAGNQPRPFVAKVSRSGNVTLLR